MTATELPGPLAEIADDFRSASNDLKLQLLLEFSDELPALPERYAGQLDRLERVDECQTPLFLVVEVEQSSAAAERRVHLFFDAPAESPTTRGFAGILHAGLDGLSPEEVLAVPDDAPMRFGLAEAVSPLRLRGMAAMLARIKRQVREKSAA
ncbi:SufE family protein [Intrasporangium calvum]|uniref:Fe-S metabolism associated SufE n=1 Tax=Intrasporangium calvum (strain ATCC 23552 / DSM 43043 / JCM 3097 / NBRC 12989 / NCIMB 10167 / NRRL B-3866 / 7 KIP) TaxID=710696 RepID=E6SFK4_INTC7|nr:SufE family protein [Intrasporangium calvum]ADU47749.1 Fe-S metabolism associated SufE [Intrasporangium calvum DSM 43043]AXG12871.1 SufE family protein [Intrasporangium calvum]